VIGLSSTRRKEGSLAIAPTHAGTGTRAPAFLISKAVSPPASRVDATCFRGDKSRQNRSCREGARQSAPGPLRCSVQAGRAELAALRSLRHAASLFPPGPALPGAIEADARPPNVRCMSLSISARGATAPRSRRHRVSRPRTEVSGCAFLSDRRERVRNRPFAARDAGNRAEGPAASPGSVSWLLPGAPRSNSLKPAQPAAKRPLMFNEFRSYHFESTWATLAAKPHLTSVEYRSLQLPSTPDRMAPTPTIGGKPLK